MTLNDALLILGGIKGELYAEAAKAKEPGLDRFIAERRVEAVATAIRSLEERQPLPQHEPSHAQ
jgi:hypothetical protein